MKYNSISQINSSFPVLICTEAFYTFLVKQKGPKNESNLLAQFKEFSMSNTQTPYLKCIRKKNLLVFCGDRNHFCK